TVAGFAAGGEDVRGITVAGGYLTIEPGGRLEGLSASAFNRVRGEQVGVSIGFLNYARHLKGVQFGVINYARNNPKFLRILPLINLHF
ncbi:MAG: hypothetical protein KDI38_17580, partial [Calditrichaeota bacterium]|nr:hypothetical protein [Calditrichota bacterium]